MESATPILEEDLTSGKSLKHLPEETASIAAAQKGAPFAIAFCCIATIVAINLLCYYRSLGGYFLADDFVHISYLAKVFDGHPEMLWQNFAGNWMQAQGTQFYRPLISLTLALDYLVGGSNPLAFHLSNMAYQIASAVFLFLFSRQLLRNFSWKQATAASFLAAALFSVHPLHPEVVSWVIGRVDSVCTTFYLGAMWLFLRAEERKSRFCLALSIGVFILSLLSKEMAVTMPAALTLLIFLRSNGSWRTRMGAAFKATTALWLVLLAFIGLRTAALGTIAGGYSGSIGEGFNASVFKRFFQDGSFLRVLFPLNAEIFPAWDKTRRWLAILYSVAGISILLRLSVALSAGSQAGRGYFANSLQKAGLHKEVLFAAGWFVIAMLPAIPVWNLTETLQCSRFIYLGSAPLCLLAALLVFPLFNEARNKCPSQLTALAGKCAWLLGAGLLALIVIAYGSIAYKNNLPWVHAGQQTRAFRAALEHAVQGLPSNKNLALLNTPQRLQGAHMVYNGAMLSVLLSKPLSREALLHRVASFEPPMYGDSELISIERVRDLITSGDFAFYKWDGARLIPLNLRYENSAVDLKIGDARRQTPSWPNRPQQALLSPDFSVDAAQIDFVLVQAKCSPAKEPNPGFFGLNWRGTADPFFSPGFKMSQPIQLDGQWHEYAFPVSEHKSWLMAERINQLKLYLPQQANVELNNVRLISGDQLIPKLRISKGTSTSDGIWHLRPKNISFSYDGSKVAFAQRLQLEVSNADSWFEHYSGTLRDREPSSHHGALISLPALQGNAALDAKLFRHPGFYEVRLVAQNETGSAVGYVSDPVNLQISP